MNNTLPAFRCSPSDSIGTRASLIHRIKNWSDDESWQEFFSTYWQTIYGVAINAGLTESEAEEVVQATIVSVAKRIREFDYKPEVGSFKHWLLNQANWRIADQLRDRQRDVRRHQRPSQTATSTRTRTIEKVIDAMHDPDRLWQREWNKSFARTTLQRVKAQVKPKHYQIFDLYVVKGWPLKKVSETLQVNIAQVYLISSRVSRLLKKQRRRVEKELERNPPALPSQASKTSIGL